MPPTYLSSRTRPDRSKPSPSSALPISTSKLNLQARTQRAEKMSPRVSEAARAVSGATEDTTSTLTKRPKHLSRRSFRNGRRLHTRSRSRSSRSRRVGAQGDPTLRFTSRDLKVHDGDRAGRTSRSFMNHYRESIGLATLQSMRANAVEAKNEAFWTRAKRRPQLTLPLTQSPLEEGKLDGRCITPDTRSRR